MLDKSPFLVEGMSAENSSANRSPAENDHAVDSDEEYRKLRWLFTDKELRETPSFLNDLVDAATEARYRLDGGRTIYAVGGKLGIKPWPTLCTACYYFQRFFMVHSFRRFNRNIAALACLFIAAKVEEEPKKCYQMVEAAKEVLDKDAISRMGNMEDEIIYTESQILLALRFDLTIKHPYHFVCEYAKIFSNLETDANSKKRLVQGAFGMINDCNKTTLLLQHEPEILAVAALHLSSKMNHVELNFEGKEKEVKPCSTSSRRLKAWYDKFVENMTDELLKDICDTVLDLHSNVTTKNEKSKAANISPSISTPVTSSVAAPQAPSVTPSLAPSVVQPQATSAVPPIATNAAPLPASCAVPPPPPPPPTIIREQPPNNSTYTNATAAYDPSVVAYQQYITHQQQMTQPPGPYEQYFPNQPIQPRPPVMPPHRFRMAPHSTYQYGHPMHPQQFGHQPLPPKLLRRSDHQHRQFLHYY